MSVRNPKYRWRNWRKGGNWTGGGNRRV